MLCFSIVAVLCFFLFVFVCLFCALAFAVTFVLVVVVILLCHRLYPAPSRFIDGNASHAAQLVVCTMLVECMLPTPSHVLHAVWSVRREHSFELNVLFG